MKGCFKTVVSFLLLLTTTIILNLSTTNALTTIVIPDKIRLNQRTGQPRICSVIGGALNIMTRVALLGGSSTSKDKLQIKVKAESNRAAIQGKLQQVSIRVQDSKSLFRLLEVDTFEVEGSNLKLGWMPLIISAGLPLTFFLHPARRLVSFVWTLSCYYYLWTLIQKLLLASQGLVEPAIEKQTTQTPFDKFKLKLKKLVGGEPSELQYTVVLSNDNLANSVLLKQACKFLLNSLMQSSVLQTAAIVGDVVQENNNRLEQNTNTNTNTNTQTNTRTNAAGELAIWQQQQQQQQQQQPLQQANNNQLSKLLSATSFTMLQAPTFNEGKYLQFNSQAVLPDDQGRLDFVLRTKIRGGGMGNDDRNNSDNGPGVLQFVQSECGFDITKATSYLPLPNIVSNFLPKVLWLPVGSGIAIGGRTPSQSPGGDGDHRARSSSFHSIESAQVLSEGKCRIQGRLSFLQKPTLNSAGGLVRRRR